MVKVCSTGAKTESTMQIECIVALVFIACVSVLVPRDISSKLFML